jgi:hypothetical protein
MKTALAAAWIIAGLTVGATSAAARPVQFETESSWSADAAKRGASGQIYYWRSGTC